MMISLNTLDYPFIKIGKIYASDGSPKRLERFGNSAQVVRIFAMLRRDFSQSCGPGVT
jgi:hypothetical protein